MDPIGFEIGPLGAVIGPPGQFQLISGEITVQLIRVYAKFSPLIVGVGTINTLEELLHDEIFVLASPSSTSTSKTQHNVLLLSLHKTLIVNKQKAYYKGTRLTRNRIRARAVWD